MLNMLMTEWNWDDAKQVWQEEAREEGIEQGEKKRNTEIALKMKTAGRPLEEIADFTSLSTEAIEQL